MKRINSGIPGLDEAIGGGIPDGFLVLVSGQCGSGKTIFGLQFLCSSNEPGIFVSFEEDLQNIREMSKIFGWNIEKLEASGKLRLLRYDPYRFQDIFDIIENNIREMGAKRIVVDSISAMGIYIHDTPELRRLVIQLGALMRKYKSTGILLSEITSLGDISRFGVEEFVCDGVIILENVLKEKEYQRRMHVMKMRLSNNSKKVHLYEIANNGIRVM